MLGYSLSQPPIVEPGQHREGFGCSAWSNEGFGAPIRSVGQAVKFCSAQRWIALSKPRPGLCVPNIASKQHRNHLSLF